MSSLFNGNKSFIINNNASLKDEGVMCTLSISGEENKNFRLVEAGEGNNSARLQIDATLDGNLHVIGSPTGLGQYRMTFYDGPVNDCDSRGNSNSSDDSSVMKWYTSTKDLQSRKATITFYWTSINGNRISTKKIATLKGIIAGMSTAMAELNHVTYFGVSLSIVGVWS